MSDRITARDIMSTAFLKLSGATPLRDVLPRLTSRDGGARAVVVEGEGGVVLGLVTPRLLLRALFRDGVPERAPDEERSAEDRLLDQARQRLDDPVRTVVSHVPLAASDDPLVRLLRITKDEAVDCLLVSGGGSVKGVVWVADIFRAAAALSLTPEVSRRSGEN
ncbi:MAG TPA: CBS domain-containing protein [bacterium]|nr:CBS domain-containing protein [bacterium]